MTYVEGFITAGPEAFTIPHGARLSDRFTRLPLPPVGHPERIAHAQQVAAAQIGFDSVFLVGDGAVVCALRERVFADARVETFFNHPARKSA